MTTSSVIPGQSQTTLPPILRNARSTVPPAQDRSKLIHVRALTSHWPYKHVKKCLIRMEILRFVSFKMLLASLFTSDNFVCI